MGTMAVGMIAATYRAVELPGHERTMAQPRKWGPVHQIKTPINTYCSGTDRVSEVQWARIIGDNHATSGEQSSQRAKREAATQIHALGSHSLGYLFNNLPLGLHAGDNYFRATSREDISNPSELL